MKKNNRGLALVTAMASMLVLGACGASSEAETTDVSVPETEAATVVDTATKSGEESKEAVATESYGFTYKGITIHVNDSMEGVIEALGEPVNYFEAASCAFEGLDKTYTYTSFELTSYPQQDGDHLADIYFKDDTIQTEEGISLYMSKEDMEKAYGTDYSVDGNSYIYERGEGQLVFIIEENEIVSIEYVSTVKYLG